MSCSPFDLRDYLFEELALDQKRTVEAHLAGCPECKQEVERLRLTRTALFSLQDEELPQRIGFVSDPVFEPSPWRRAWAAFWTSGARIGFVSAAMLSAAIVYSAVTRPAPAPVVSHTQSATLTAAEVQGRIDAAVSQAKLEIEASQAKKTETLVRDLERKDNTKLHNVIAMADAQTEYLLGENDKYKAQLRTMIQNASASAEVRP